MNLILDAGNTCVKLFIFNDKDIKNKFIFNYPDFLENVKNIFQDYKFNNVLLSGIENLKKYLPSFNYNFFDANVIKFSNSTPIPIANNYATPKTLGCDRLAAAAGAATIFPNQNAFIIDAGTCITFDYLKEGKTFLGGIISPGLQMRAKAMNVFTSTLPEIKISDVENLSKIPRSTIEALQNGVVQGVINEINGYIDNLSNVFSSAKIILTGGDTVFLAKRLKNTIFAEPNLVAIGLNEILTYNVKTL